MWLEDGITSMSLASSFDFLNLNSRDALAVVLACADAHPQTIG